MLHPYSRSQAPAEEEMMEGYHDAKRQFHPLINELQCL